MPRISIHIDYPKGTTVTVAQDDATPAQSNGHDAVARYFNEYLSDNGRKLYRAAAELEQVSGPGYTLEDVAEHMGMTYQSAQSLHRTTGRPAKRWSRETGDQQPPICLDYIEYEYDGARGGMRTTYGLPQGVAEAIQSL